MEGILYIAALIAAVAFAVLVVFLGITFMAVKRTMNSVANTMDSMEKQLVGITTETTELLKKTNVLAEDVINKTGKLEGIFDGAKGIGETLMDFNESIKHITSQISRNASQNQEKAAQSVKWGAALFDLWKKNRNK
ncbi:DUF948 domain-containing protein [Virgibacillus soli]|uniref:DUF948 domain-containing protein n=1 Tax=Paracerasibacillus soli TaxID=480284 RepID=UPI0035EC26E7